MNEFVFWRSDHFTYRWMNMQPRGWTFISPEISMQAKQNYCSISVVHTEHINTCTQERAHVTGWGVSMLDEFLHTASVIGLNSLSSPLRLIICVDSFFFRFLLLPWTSNFLQEKYCNWLTLLESKSGKLCALAGFSSQRFQVCNPLGEHAGL